MWEAQVGALEATGWTVEAPGLPPPDAEPGFAGWAQRLLAETPSELAVVGCSMGGYLAFELWRQAPERIRALVLVDTRAGPEPEAGRATRDALIRAVEDDGASALWPEERPPVFSPSTPPEIVERARAVVREQSADRLTAALAAIRDRADSRPTLATISLPTLVLVGEDDEVTPPAEAEAIAAAVPGAHLVRVPGCGHLAPLERPAEVTRELVTFLRRLDG